MPQWKVVAEEILAEGVVCEFRRHPSAKVIRLALSAGGRIWITLPPRASLAEGKALLAQHKESLLAQRATLLHRKESAATPAKVPWWGVWYDVRVEAGRPSVSIDEGSAAARVAIPERLISSPTADAVALLVWRAWAELQAKKQLRPMIEFHRNRLGLHVEAVRIKSVKTRWGSCSKRNRSINLNWKCALLPRFVCEAIICHELAHLTHANHSPQFWDLARAYDPNTDRAEQWLRREQQNILTFLSTVEHYERQYRQKADV